MAFLRKALKLSEETRPKGCNAGEGDFCPEHSKMVRSRTVGYILIKIIGWAAPILLLVLLTVLSFTNTRITSVEASLDHHMKGSNEKLDQIHHSVMTIEFNVRKEMGEDFVDLKTKEDY